MAAATNGPARQTWQAYVEYYRPTVIAWVCFVAIGCFLLSLPMNTLMGPAFFLFVLNMAANDAWVKYVDLSDVPMATRAQVYQEKLTDNDLEHRGRNAVMGAFFTAICVLVGIVKIILPERLMLSDLGFFPAMALIAGLGFYCSRRVPVPALALVQAPVFVAPPIASLDFTHVSQGC
jgi:hypothetical protein